MTILKSIVVCLALANIGYFLWFRGIAQSQEAPAAAPATKLRLASEAGDAAREASDAAAGARQNDGSDALLTNVKRCVSVGPFHDVAEAAHAASTLRSGGYDPRQRVAEGEVVWIDIDLKPTDSVPKPSDLQSETGRIQRLEVKACPNAGAVP